MILHENHLLVDDSHEKSYLIFFQKLGKMSQNLSSAAVVIGALRVNRIFRVKECATPYGPQCKKTCLWGFGNNKDAYRSAHPHSLISTFVI